MEIEVVTRIILEKSPYLTESDAREKAREFCRQVSSLSNGWKKSLELLTITYQYQGLEETEARRKAEELRPALQSLNRKSSRSRKRWRDHCVLTANPRALLEGDHEDSL